MEYGRKGGEVRISKCLPSCLLFPSTSVFSPTPNMACFTDKNNIFSELLIYLRFMYLYTSSTFLTISILSYTTPFLLLLLRFLSNSCCPWPDSYHFTSLSLSWDQFSSVLRRKTMADGTTRLQMQVGPHTISRLFNPSPFHQKICSTTTASTANIAPGISTLQN